MPGAPNAPQDEQPKNGKNGTGAAAGSGSPSSPSTAKPKDPLPFRPFVIPSKAPAAGPGALGSSLNLAKDVDRSRAIRVLTAAQTARAPVSLVSRNLDFVEGEIKKRDFDPERFEMAGSPLERIYAEDPNWVPVIREDDAGRAMRKLSEIYFRLDDTRRPSTPAEIERRANEFAARNASRYVRRVMSRRLPPAGGGGFFGDPGESIARLYDQPSQMDTVAATEEARADYARYMQAEERFIASNDPIGMFEGIAERYRENKAFWVPFMGGVADLAGAVSVYEAAKAMERGDATEEQHDLLVRTARLEEAAARRGRTFMGGVGGILQELPAFAGEFVITGGAFTAGKQVVLKGTGEAVEAFVKRMGKQALASRAVRAGQATVAAGVGAAAQTAATPQRIALGIVRRMTPDGGLESEDGNIYYRVNPGSGQSFWAALPMAAYEQFVELASERTGVALAWADKPVAKIFFDSWAAKVPGRTAEGFRDLVRRAGFNGVLGEMGEEEIAKVMLAAGGQVGLHETEGYALPLTEGGTTLADLGQQAVAFGVPGATGSVLSHLDRLLTSEADAAARRERDRAVADLGRATENQEDMAAIGDAVMATKAATDFPEAIAKVTVQATKDTPSENVYVDARSFNQYVAQQTDDTGAPLDPELVARSLIGSEAMPAYRDAVATGGDMVIPMAVYASKIVPSAHRAFFQENARKDPLIDTVKNSQAAVDAIIAEQDANIAKREAEAEQRKAERAATVEAQLAAMYAEGEKQVVERVEGALKQTRFKKEARTMATFAGRVFRRLAETAGTTVEDVLRVRPLAVQEGEAAPAAGGRVAAQEFEQTAFHGSPHKFDKFSTEKIGTGEGAQAFGWGLYFAGKKEIAEYYKKSVSSKRPTTYPSSIPDYVSSALEKLGNLGRESPYAAIQVAISAAKNLNREWWKVFDIQGTDPVVKQWIGLIDEVVSKHVDNQGRLYEVELLDDKYFLEWDKPLAEQSEEVKKALEPFLAGVHWDKSGKGDGKWQLTRADGSSILWRDEREVIRDTGSGDVLDFIASMSGETFYSTLVGGKTAEESSRKLLAAGISGIRYLDATSRGRGEGSSNYVVFDDALVDIKSFEQSATDQTQTPEFRAWFGDSKVVDEAGKPLVVYHGTERKGVKRMRPSFEAGLGIFFSDNPDVSETFRVPREYGEPVYEDADGNEIEPGDLVGAFIRIENPLVLSGREAQEFVDDTVKQIAILKKAQADGHDGVIVKGVLEGIGERYPSTNYVVFDSTQVKSATGNRGTFDPTDPNILHQPGESEARGRIALGDGLALIQFLKNADRSTFFHEIGHLYLDTLAVMGSIEGASKEIREQLAATLHWLGVERADQIEEKHHEQFARALEQYLMEGKAPSAKLRRLFHRIRSWLVDVYRTARALNVELNPEIRRVFDRMLAAETEIQRVKEQEGYALLVTDFSGVGDEFRERYHHLAEEAEAAVRDKVYVENLRIERERATEAWKKEQGEVEAEIAERVDAQPIYQALRYFERRAPSEDDPRPVYKLSRKQLRKEYARARGKDAADILLDRLPRTVTGGKTAPPAVIASWFGYSSWVDFVEDLAEADPRDKLIERLTFEEMRRRHGEPSAEELQKRALEGFHSTPAAQLQQMEMEYMLRQNPDAVRAISTGNISRLIPQLEAVARGATLAIRRLLVGKINPRVYQGAERRAISAAKRALGAGKYDEAFAAARQRIVASARFSEATAALARVDRFKQRMRRLLRKSDKKLSKRRDMAFVNAARVILARYGVGRINEEDPLDYLKKVEAYDPQFYLGLKDMIYAATSGARPLNEITYAQFLDLERVVYALLERSLREREVEIEGEKRDIEEVRAEGIAAIDRVRGTKKPLDPKATTFRWWYNIKAGLRIVSQWANSWDRGDENGWFKRVISRPVQDATARYREAKTAIDREFLSVVQMLRGEWDDREIDAPELGESVKFKGMRKLLHAILHTGNPSNKRRLLLGGQSRNNPWGTESEDGTLDSSKWDAFIARLVRQGVLTKKHFDAAQRIWDLLESLKPEAQRVYKSQYGHYFDEITAEGFEIPGIGKYRGGYVPARVDRDLVHAADVRSADYELEDGSPNMYSVFPQPGFTKSRVDPYARALELDIGLLWGHVDQVLRFIHISPATRQIMRIVNHEDFREAMKAVDPKAMDEMLVPWLKRASAQLFSKPGNQLADNWLRFFRKNAALQFMAGNFVNALQQLTGLSVAAIRVKKRNLLKALLLYTKNPRRAAKDVLEQSAYMRTAAASQIFDIQRETKEILLNPNALTQAQAISQKYGYILQRGTQNIVNYIVWMGAHQQAGEAGMAPEAAVRAADEAVRDTQGEYTPEGQSNLLTSYEFVRFFTMFQTYFNTMANLLATEFEIAVKAMGLKQAAGRLLYIYAMGHMIPAVLSELILRAMSGGLDDDDDDGYVDEVASVFFGSQYRQATSLIPFAGPVVRTTVHAFSENPDRFYDDRIATSPAISVLERGVPAIANLVDAIGEDEEVSGREVRDFLSFLGLFSGIPFAAPGRPAGYITDVVQEEVEPTGPIDFARGLMTGKR